MASERHVTERLGAFLEGRLEAAQAEEVAGHLATCTSCADERKLLADGKTLFGKLPFSDAEPRVGFAFKVAQAAVEQRPARALAWRWAFGGLASAAVAAGVVLTLLPKQQVEQGSSHEMMLAQRLELYEDLSVMQNREALENLDVVEQLDQLELGKP
jgi:hypothetical protein